MSDEYFDSDACLAERNIARSYLLKFGNRKCITRKSLNSRMNAVEQ